jgi:hypothetical protein
MRNKTFEANMEDYKRIKIMLNDLRKELTDYITSTDDTQDLTKNFIKVKESDEATYELLMLIYNEFKTTNKMNRKRLINILDKALNVKIETIDKLMIERASAEGTVNKSIYSYVLDKITFANVLKAVGIWMAVVIFLLSLYKIDKEAFNTVADRSLQFIEKTDTLIKDGSK